MRNAIFLPLMFSLFACGQNLTPKSHLNTLDGRRPAPVWAMCSKEIAPDRTVFVKFTQSETDRSKWFVLAREYNPANGSDYYREESTGVSTFNPGKSTFNIQFNESDLALPVRAIENGRVFSATHRIDGDKPTVLTCFPRGIR